MTDVKLSQKEYDKMQRNLSKLYALEAGGVNNWEWFDESLKEWRKESELSEMMDDLIYEFSECVNELAIEANVDFPAGMEAGSNVMMPDSEDAARVFINMVIEKYKGLSND
jgi:hypothetical protein